MVGNQLLILLISFSASCVALRRGWESVTNPLDKLLCDGVGNQSCVGNQLLILLISFREKNALRSLRWESVTNPLDKLYALQHYLTLMLGISY